MERFVPLSRRKDSESARKHVGARHPGVPEWLRESLWDWIEQHVAATFGSGSVYPYRGLPVDQLREMERTIEFSIGWDGKKPFEGLQSLRSHLLKSPTVMLDVAEFAAVRLANENGRTLLEKILAESGSAWRVGSDGYFSERVTPAVQEAADERFTQGKPGELLRHAWAHAFGRNPSPSEAYRHAVRAVEAAAKDVVLPNNPLATLGTIIAALRDGAKKFTFAFVVDSTVKPHDVLVSMLQLLWTNQYDRHVNDDTPLHVSQEEAEAAVVLALTLVEWFVSGKIARKP